MCLFIRQTYKIRRAGRKATVLRLHFHIMCFRFHFVFIILIMNNQSKILLFCSIPILRILNIESIRCVFFLFYRLMQTHLFYIYNLCRHVFAYEDQKTYLIAKQCIDLFIEYYTYEIYYILQRTWRFFLFENIIT